MKLYGCPYCARLDAAFSSQNGICKNAQGKTAKNNALDNRQSYNQIELITEHDPFSSMNDVNSYHAHVEAKAPNKNTHLEDHQKR
jgi:hypothetical protein